MLEYLLLKDIEDSQVGIPRFKFYITVYIIIVLVTTILPLEFSQQGEEITSLEPLRSIITP